MISISLYTSYLDQIISTICYKPVGLVLSEEIDEVRLELVVCSIYFIIQEVFVGEGIQRAFEQRPGLNFTVAPLYAALMGSRKFRYLWLSMLSGNVIEATGAP